MLEVVCSVGVIGSGKDFLAQEYIAKGYKFINFADELREIAWELLSWRPRNKEEYELFKQGKIFIEGFGYVDGRIFLQNVGTSLRKRDPDYWIKLWRTNVEKELVNGNSVVCSDVRFINELQTALYLYRKEKFNKKIIFCDYMSKRRNDKNEHVSEKFAQYLIKQNKFKHREELSLDYLNCLIEKYYLGVIKIDN